MLKLFLYIPGLLALLTSMDTPPVLQDVQGNYSRYVLRDSCTIEILEYSDSVLVVETVCAPLCSSTARIYNKEYKLLHSIRPAETGMLPYAWIENGELHWRDNTMQLWDKEEQGRVTKE